jgi:hypothetical protein
MKRTILPHHTKIVSTIANHNQISTDELLTIHQNWCIVTINSALFRLSLDGVISRRVVRKARNATVNFWSMNN